MKILLVTGAIVAQNSIKKQFTGLDIVVTDLGVALSKQHEICFFTTAPLGRAASIENCSLDSYGHLELARDIRFKDFKFFIDDIFNKKLNLKQSIKNFRSKQIARRFTKCLEKFNPDLIHLHGISYSNLLCMYLALKLNKRVLVTFHGLSYKMKGVDQFQSLIEKKSIKFLLDNQMIFSVISTGIKNEIIREFSVDSNSFDNIKVINNQIRELEPVGEDNTIKHRLKITNDHFVMICVGSITANKNQKTILKAVESLPSEYRDSVILVFAGVNKLNDFEDLIKKSPIRENIYCLGFLNSSELAKLYDIAKLNIVASYSEGFGMSISEAGLFGVPTLTFRDLYAIEDLYFKEGFILPDSRKLEDFINALIVSMNRKWDSEKIKKQYQNKNNSIIYEYNELYNLVCERNQQANYPDLERII